MIPPLQHVCNGLARPADESMLVRDNGTDIGSTGSKNIITSVVHSLRRHNKWQELRYKHRIHTVRLKTVQR